MDFTDFVENDAKKDGGVISFLDENIWRPGANALVVEPYNAAANIFNAASHKLGSSTEMPKATPFEYREQSITTAAGFLQNTSSSLGSILPYVVAAEVGGAGLRTGSRILQLEGNFARFASSKMGAAATGAFIYDYSRDLRPGESRLTNAGAGAFSMAAFTAGNQFASRYTNLAERVGVRTITGVGAAEFSSWIQHGKFSGEAGLNGAIMGNLFPLAHEKLGNLADKAVGATGHSLNFQRFLDLHGLNGYKELPPSLVNSNPLAKVRFDKSNTPGPRKNTIHINEELVEIRTQEMLEKAKESGTPLDESTARKHALAIEVGGEFADLNVARAGRSGAVFTDREIMKATLDGRIQIQIEKPNAAGVMEFQPMTLRELRKKLGANSLDVTLGNQFSKPVSEPTDFRTISPKDSLKRLSSFEVPDGGAVVIQPGEALLAFIKEKIVLAENPLPSASGLPAVIGDINLNSSLARHFLEIHQTAPTLNNGTKNRITLEIVNNGPAPLTLTPGMTFGSIKFLAMTGYHSPLETPSAMHGQNKPNGAK